MKKSQVGRLSSRLRRLKCRKREEGGFEWRGKAKETHIYAFQMSWQSSETQFWNRLFPYSYACWCHQDKSSIRQSRKKLLWLCRIRTQIRIAMVVDSYKSSYIIGCKIRLEFRPMCTIILLRACPAWPFLDVGTIECHRPWLEFGILAFSHVWSHNLLIGCCWRLLDCRSGISLVQPQFYHGKNRVSGETEFSWGCNLKGAN